MMNVPRMISHQFFRNTSDTGALTRSFCAIALAKTGVSSMRSRTYRPTPTMTIDSRNGIRQPHTRNGSVSSAAVES